jgi:hypothetical protein
MIHNDMNNTHIEHIVMRRVRTIRIMRALLSNGALAILALVVALWGIGREVWVARVLQNAPHNIAFAPAFYLAAFMHTRLVVQALSLATLAALILLARETAQGLAALLTPNRAHA